MSKYFQIALALAIFTASPALGGTADHAAKQSTQNLRISDIAHSQGTTYVWMVRKLHNSVDTSRPVKPASCDPPTHDV